MPEFSDAVLSHEKLQRLKWEQHLGSHQTNKSRTYVGVGWMIFFFPVQSGAIPESLKACKHREDRCSLLSVRLNAAERTSKWEEKNVPTYTCPVPWEVIQAS